MNEQLRLLIELQKLDSTILSSRLKIDAIPAAIASYESLLKKTEAVYESAKQTHASLEKKKKDKEQEIEDIKEKIKKLTQRTSEIKTNKEYQAHLKEIEKIDKSLKSAEDELLSIIDSIEGSSKVMEIEKNRIAEEKIKTDAIKKDLQNEIYRCMQDIERLKSTRKSIVDKIDSDIYKEYMTVLKTGYGVAVVEAKDETCQGCNMNIPPQLFVEIKTSDEIIECPQCKRILYYAKAEVTE